MDISAFPETSTREDWVEDIQFINDDDGTLVDLTPYTQITMKVWKDAGRSGSGPAGGIYSDCGWGGYEDDGFYAPITGTLTGGDLTVIALNTLHFRYPASRLNGMGRGTYKIGITATDGTNTVQLLLGTVNFYEGLNDY